MSHAGLSASHPSNYGELMWGKLDDGMWWPIKVLTENEAAELKNLKDLPEEGVPVKVLGDGKKGESPNILVHWRLTAGDLRPILVHRLDDEVQEATELAQKSGHDAARLAALRGGIKQLRLELAARRSEATNAAAVPESREASSSRADGAAEPPREGAPCVLHRESVPPKEEAAGAGDEAIAAAVAAAGGGAAGKEETNSSGEWAVPTKHAHSPSAAASAAPAAAAAAAPTVECAPSLSEGEARLATDAEAGRLAVTDAAADSLLGFSKSEQKRPRGRPSGTGRRLGLAQGPGEELVEPLAPAAGGDVQGEATEGAAAGDVDGRDQRGAGRGRGRGPGGRGRRSFAHLALARRQRKAAREREPDEDEDDADYAAPGAGEGAAAGQRRRPAASRGPLRSVQSEAEHEQAPPEAGEGPSGAADDWELHYRGAAAEGSALAGEPEPRYAVGDVVWVRWANQWWPGSIEDPGQSEESRRIYQEGLQQAAAERRHRPGPAQSISPQQYLVLFIGERTHTVNSSSEIKPFDWSFEAAAQDLAGKFRKKLDRYLHIVHTDWVPRPGGGPAACDTGDEYGGSYEQQQQALLEWQRAAARAEELTLAVDALSNLRWATHLDACWPVRLASARVRPTLEEACRAEADFKATYGGDVSLESGICTLVFFLGTESEGSQLLQRFRYVPTANLAPMEAPLPGASRRPADQGVNLVPLPLRHLRTLAVDALKALLGAHPQPPEPLLDFVNSAVMVWRDLHGNGDRSRTAGGKKLPQVHPGVAIIKRSRYHADDDEVAPAQAAAPVKYMRTYADEASPGSVAGATSSLLGKLGKTRRAVKSPMPLAPLPSQLPRQGLNGAGAPIMGTSGRQGLGAAAASLDQQDGPVTGDVTVRDGALLREQRGNAEWHARLKAADAERVRCQENELRQRQQNLAQQQLAQQHLAQWAHAVAAQQHQHQQQQLHLQLPTHENQQQQVIAFLQAQHHQALLHAHVQAQLQQHAQQQQQAQKGQHQRALQQAQQAQQEQQQAQQQQQQTQQQEEQAELVQQQAHGSPESCG